MSKLRGTPSQKAVAYYRVSTKEQGESKLGLEAQEATVKNYVAFNGMTIVATFTETESGTKNDRDRLTQALSACRRYGARLIIAKLDRLSRDLGFIDKLQKDGVDFVCCDNPHANKMTIQFFAIIAQNEAQVISERTKAALAALKARGVLLGGANPSCANNLNQEARLKGAALAAVERSRLCSEADALVSEHIRSMRQSETPFAEIAKQLNTDGTVTRQHKRWTATQVRRVWLRTNPDAARLIYRKHRRRERAA
jgi:DNA invertase Pin-like site-specific DNA recombinase